MSFSSVVDNQYPHMSHTVVRVSPVHGPTLPGGFVQRRKTALSISHTKHQDRRVNYEFRSTLR